MDRLSRARECVFRGTLLGVSVLLGVGVIEVGIRVLGLAPATQSGNDTAIVLYYEEPNGPIELSPGWHGDVSGWPTTISKQGFRDRIFAPRPPAGRTRIAFIGDSYTMGDGVALESTFVKRLEASLVSEMDVEIMNCAISATNTVQQVATVERVLAEFTPDIVAVAFNVNDFKVYEQTRFERLRQAGFALDIRSDGTVHIDKVALGTVGKIKVWLSRHVAVYRMLTRHETCR